MRNLLFGAVALAGMSVLGAAQAAPRAVVLAYEGPAVAVPVQYYEDWRAREWRRHQEWERHRRWEEWRRHREWREHRGW